MSRWHSQALILMFALLCACGPKSRQDFRSEGAGESDDATKDEAVTPPAPDASPQIPPSSPAEDGENPAETETDGRKTFLRKITPHYSQWDEKLRDLFSESAESQLCWPAALASEMSYLREYRTPSVQGLPEVGRGAAKTTDEIRYFTKLCGTDLDDGTTVIQGARCIAKHVEEASLKLDLHIAGLDAQWGAFNLFPKGTTIQRGVLEPARIPQDLKKGTSVILMIGFYGKSGNGWKRDRGHFVAVTGFAHEAAWGSDQLELRIMNPANAPAGTVDGAPYETVTLKRVPSAEAPATDVGFALIGEGFSDVAKPAFVESIIAFDVVTQ